MNSPVIRRALQQLGTHLYSLLLSVGKDKRSLSLLQVGKVSKVVDENGEPLVVYHGTPLLGVK